MLRAKECEAYIGSNGFLKRLARQWHSCSAAKVPIIYVNPAAATQWMK